MAIDLRRSGKIPMSFEEGYCNWKVIRREKLWVLCEGKPVDGNGVTRWSVCSVCQDDGNSLFMRPSITVSDLEKGSIFLDKAKMEEVFEQKAQEEKGRNAELSRKAAAQERANEQILNWRQKVDLLRIEQSNLIEELKKLNEVDDTKVISSKRTKEICSRLAEIESYIHHGRPRTVAAGAVS